MPSIFFGCFYEPSLQVFRFMALFQDASVLVHVFEIYMIEFPANAFVVELFSEET